jgi:hypothetical protein
MSMTSGMSLRTGKSLTPGMGGIEVCISGTGISRGSACALARPVEMAKAANATTVNKQARAGGIVLLAFIAELAVGSKLAALSRSGDVEDLAVLGDGAAG